MITIKQISITELSTDAIVNAANEHLQAGGGVCGAIFSAAGYDKLQAALTLRRKISFMQLARSGVVVRMERCKHYIMPINVLWSLLRRMDAALSDFL